VHGTDARVERSDHPVRPVTLWVIR